MLSNLPIPRMGLKSDELSILVPKSLYEKSCLPKFSFPGGASVLSEDTNKLMLIAVGMMWESGWVGFKQMPNDRAMHVMSSL